MEQQVKRRALLLLNGDLPTQEEVREESRGYDLLVSADGASDILWQAGVIPDLIIGDLDSISEEVRSFFEGEKVRFLKFPPEKDKTDGHLAVETLIEEGMEEIFIYGGLGGRWDQSLGNLGLFSSALECDIDLVFVSSDNTMTCKKPGRYIFPYREGWYFSILAYGDRVEGIDLKGAKYELRQAVIKKGETVGISNEYRGDIDLSFDKGELLIIESRFDRRG
ncbi:MAG: thiamine diphosphokinase [Filifactor alocis]|nr:thiamine diphosphokinase [Filifactor alocis]